jgi:hypothetical protein
MHFAVVVSTLDSHRDGYERLPTLLENPKRMLDLYLRMGVAIIEKFIAILPLTPLGLLVRGHASPCQPIYLVS